MFLARYYENLDFQPKPIFFFFLEIQRHSKLWKTFFSFLEEFYFQFFFIFVNFFSQSYNIV